jgi:hypothetical protein
VIRSVRGGAGLKQRRRDSFSKTNSTNPMHNSTNAPAADTGKPARILGPAAPGQKPRSTKTTNASGKAPADSDTYLSPPTLAETKVYWALSRS